MKVLQVIASMDPASGGTAQGIRNSIPELKKLGVENEVVCLDSPTSDYLVHDDFKVYALGPSKGPWQYGEQLRPWLQHHLLDYDAIVINGLWLYHGYAVNKTFRALKRRRSAKEKLPKLFVMPHGMLDPYFQKAEGRRLKAIRNWVYWKFIESKVVNNADGLFFTANAELLLARQSFSPYCPKNEFNVGYGILPPPPFELKFSDALFSKAPQLKGRTYILFLSRIHEKKGVDLLLKAYSQLIDELKVQSDFNYGRLPALVIAGPGADSDYGKQITSMVSHDKDLQKLVVMPGMLSGDYKWGAFYNTEVFVLPSHQENFGIAVVEALSCGKPVLITDKVNIWQEIDNEHAGIIFDDNVDGLKDALKRWLALSLERKTAMGYQANKAYKKYFKIKTAALSFIEALKS